MASSQKQRFIEWSFPISFLATFLPASIPSIWAAKGSWKNKERMRRYREIKEQNTIFFFYIYPRIFSRNKLCYITNNKTTILIYSQTLNSMNYAFYYKKR